uniref:Replication-associated protein n=1 Tax=Lorikeet CRESS-DNA-virus sp. TaxID=2815042 RepID=A0A8A4XC95_9VIRU|nr:MAG: replication-associated protein [Lorikeet CRESS-DNA-virus sp.]
MAAAFRFNAKTAFLTYPQCDATKEDLLAHLIALPVPPVYVIVSRELHEDGMPHLHAVVCWKTKVDRSGDMFHFGISRAHIQPARSIVKCIEYVKKDGDFVEHGVTPDKKQAWLEVFQAVDKRDFWTKMVDLSPRDVVMNHEKLEYFANKKFCGENRTRVAPVDLQEFILPDALSTWLRDEFNGTHRRRKSLVLYGASRLGKTEWARSLGHHMYFNALANFKDKWDDDAGYVIFDDFGIDFIPNRKGFFGGQEEFEITGKYMKVKSVTWGKVCIYLCNDKPDYGKDKQWFMANVVEIELINKLY